MIPNVMHLLSSFGVGGAETVALELARMSNGPDFRVCVCSLTGPGPMQARFEAVGVPSMWLRRSRLIPGLDVLLVARLARLLSRESVQVLHCHNAFAKIYGALAGRLARVPVLVCTQHSVGFRTGSPAPFLHRLANPLVSHFVAVADYVLDAASMAGYVAAERASVIHNGIDTDRFAARAQRRRARGDPVVLGSVGRLSREKRYSLLLRAVAELTRRGASVNLCLVGDGAERAALGREAERLGLRERVDFVGMCDDVPAQLARMDVFVLSSATEGLPLVVIEAMAVGLPVVATRVGGVPELVQDGVNGLLVEPQKPAKLAAAIRRLVEDPDMRHRMGTAGRKMAVERFDLRVAARRHEDLYGRLLAEKGMVGR